MAVLAPCIKSKMGSTEYFLARLSARELAQSVRIAREHDDWANRGIEERMQRELNEKRVRSEIAPYLARSADRFFGSVIVLVSEQADLTFEAVGDLNVKLPRAYTSIGQELGFITIAGGELVVLDGQHRLAAIRSVIQHEVEGAHAGAVASDELAVMFIRHESNEKTRRIFNKVNRHAAPTSRSDNLITSEDDGYAIIARRLLDGPFQVKHAEGIVDWRSNTLAKRSTKLTTLSAVYETVKLILSPAGLTSFDERHMINRPADDLLDTAYETAAEFWELLLSEVEPFRKAAASPHLIPDLREESSRFSLLMKPIAQIATVQGLLKAAGRGVDRTAAVRRLNAIDWRMSPPGYWENVLVNPNNTINKNEEAKSRSADLIAYLVGAEKMSNAEIRTLQREYNRARGFDAEKAPASAKLPYDLPEPIKETRAAKEISRRATRQPSRQGRR